MIPSLSRTAVLADAERYFEHLDLYVQYGQFSAVRNPRTLVHVSGVITSPSMMLI